MRLHIPAADAAAHTFQDRPRCSRQARPAVDPMLLPIRCTVACCARHCCPACCATALLPAAASAAAQTPSADAACPACSLLLTGCGGDCFAICCSALGLPSFGVIVTSAYSCRPLRCGGRLRKGWPLRFAPARMPFPDAPAGMCLCYRGQLLTPFIRPARRHQQEYPQDVRAGKVWRGV